MRTLVRLLVAAVLSALVLGGAVPPAGAQTKVRRDAAGDTDPSYDLRAATVRNGHRLLVVRLRVAEVQRRQTGAFVSFSRPRRDGDAYFAEVRPTARGSWTTRLLRTVNDVVAPVECRGVRVSVRPGRQGTLRLVVPQRCLGDDAGRQQVVAWTYGRRGPQTDRPEWSDDADSPVVVTTRRG